jgi:hypothetical protein
MAAEVDWIIEFENIQGEYSEIINWLIDHVDDVERQTDKDYAGRPKPYHFSAISQFARFVSINKIWYLEIRGNQQKKTVRFSDQATARQLTEFALKWTPKNT